MSHWVKVEADSYLFYPFENSNGVITESVGKIKASTRKKVEAIYKRVNIYLGLHISMIQVNKQEDSFFVGFDYFDHDRDYEKYLKVRHKIEDLEYSIFVGKESIHIACDVRRVLNGKQ